jgi:hypothetical protein
LMWIKPGRKRRPTGSTDTHTAMPLTPREREILRSIAHGAGGERGCEPNRP